jgi:hypothetical protein
VKRAGETGSGGRGATGDAGWRAGAWDEQTHKQNTKFGRKFFETIQNYLF